MPGGGAEHEMGSPVRCDEDERAEQSGGAEYSCQAAALRDEPRTKPVGRSCHRLGTSRRDRSVTGNREPFGNGRTHVLPRQRDAAGEQLAGLTACGWLSTGPFV